MEDNRTVEITLAEYRELLRYKTRVDVLEDFFNTEQYINKQEIGRIMGYPKEEQA